MIQFERAAFISAVFSMALLVGCQGSNADIPTGIDTEQTVPDEGQIMERADARTRAKAHVDLAAAYYEAGRLAVALDEARIAMTADPTYPQAYNIQGLVNFDMRDNLAAEQSFKRGLQLSPQDPDLNHNYGWFLCRTGRESEATQWFMTAIKNPLYTTPARSYAAAASCLQTKNPAEAGDLYERALRLDPANPNTLQSYANFLFQQNRIPEARALLERYTVLVPEPNAEALWLLLRVARKQGDRNAEASYGAQLRRRFPKSPQAAALLRGAYE